MGGSWVHATPFLRFLREGTLSKPVHQKFGCNSGGFCWGIVLWARATLGENENAGGRHPLWFIQTFEGTTLGEVVSVQWFATRQKVRHPTVRYGPSHSKMSRRSLAYFVGAPFWLVKTRLQALDMVPALPRFPWGHRRLPSSPQMGLPAKTSTRPGSEIRSGASLSPQMFIVSGLKHELAGQNAHGEFLLGRCHGCATAHAHVAAFLLHRGTLRARLLARLQPPDCSGRAADGWAYVWPLRLFSPCEPATDISTGNRPNTHQMQRTIFISSCQGMLCSLDGVLVCPSWAISTKCT